MTEQEKIQELIDMKLHEVKDVATLAVMRVVGGFMYYSKGGDSFGGVFVPEPVTGLEAQKVEQYKLCLSTYEIECVSTGGVEFVEAESEDHAYAMVHHRYGARPPIRKVKKDGE